MTKTSNKIIYLIILFSGSLILVADGYSSQVVDLNSNTLCSNLQKVPSAVLGATGAVLDNKPTICGGGGYNYEYKKSCYAYDKSSQSWFLHAKMNTTDIPELVWQWGLKFDASATVINGSLWISGGQNRDNSGLREKSS